MSAGTITMRTTKASNSTPIAMPRPMGRIMVISEKTKPPNTAAMMIAAAVTTARPWRTPATTASRAEAPCTYASRMPLVMKSW